MSGPKTVYSSALPEAVDERKNEVKTQSTNRLEPASHLLTRRFKIISVAITAIIIVGLALGVGLGEGLRQNSSVRSNSQRSASNTTRTITSKYIL